MAHYQVTVDDEVLQHLFSRDDGLTRLVEQVLNQILEAQVTEQLKVALCSSLRDNLPQKTNRGGFSLMTRAELQELWAARIAEYRASGQSVKE